MTNEELCELYQSGNADALGELYAQNTGLIEKAIQRYSGLEDPEDLRQESFFAIRHAAALWDHSKGANFATYCTYWLHQTARRYILNNCGTIRAPVHARERIRQYNRAANAYRVTFGRDPSNEELCYALNLSKQQLEDLRRDMVTLSTRSTSAPVGEDGESTVEDFLKDDRDQMGEVLDKIHREEIHRAIEKEIAANVGISPERIRQLEERALRKLRRPAPSRRLNACYSEGGAYSAGLRGTGLKSFKYDHTSAQERAIMKLEEIAARMWENWGVTPQKMSYAAK